MTPMKIAAAALLLGSALTAPAALAQQPSSDQRFGRPVDRSPVNVHNCSLSRSCAPGPYVSIVPYVSRGARKSGTLHLAILPSHADVYVDGVYAGRADDFGGNSQRSDLKVGTHRVELRAEGYQAVQFDTRIEKGRTTFHRATLSPLGSGFGE